MESDQPTPPVLAAVHLVVAEVPGTASYGYTSTDGQHVVSAPRALLDGDAEAAVSTLRALIEQATEAAAQQGLTMTRAVTKSAAILPAL